MSKIIVIGNDPSLRERVRHTQRRRMGQTVQVEYLDLTNNARLAPKRPEAVVLDVRSPNKTTFDVFFQLKTMTHQPSLMLQVTPRQMRDNSWTQILPAKTVLFTSRTSNKVFHNSLQELLTTRTASRQTTPPAESPETHWRTQNDRRIDLIFQERDRGLTAPEQAELARLQDGANRHVNRRRTLDFDALADFESEARKISERD